MPGLNEDEILGDLIVETLVNLSLRSVNNPTLRLKKASGTFFTRDYGAGADQNIRTTIIDEILGRVKITFVSGELTGGAGTWQGQIRCDFTDGRRTYGDIFSFQVGANLT